MEHSTEAPEATPEAPEATPEVSTGTRTEGAVEVSSSADAPALDTPSSASAPLAAEVEPSDAAENPCAAVAQPEPSVAVDVCGPDVAEASAAPTAATSSSAGAPGVGQRWSASATSDGLEQADHPSSPTSASSSAAPASMPAPSAASSSAAPSASSAPSRQQLDSYAAASSGSSGYPAGSIGSEQAMRSRKSAAPRVYNEISGAAAGASGAAPSKPVGEWSIRVDRSSGTKLGMSINKNKLRVENVLPNGLIAAWNDDNPELALEIGCRIVSVNGCTKPDDIFKQCAGNGPLEIVVRTPLSRERASLPANINAKEQLPHQASAQETVPQNGGSVSNPIADGQTENTVEVTEFQTLILGPFQAGVVCEITEASYGCPGDETKQIDVTDVVRSCWDNEVGMKLSGFNKLFHKDPAPLRFKRLSVSYRLHNVKAWDVSRARYTEGVNKLGLVLPIVTKALSNVVGATVAASGYAIGKAETKMRGMVLSDENRTVADSEVFQWGFTTWLACNGIFPSVSYEELGKPGKRLRRMHYPDEEPFMPYQPQDMKMTPLLVSNHVCYIDGPVLAALFGAPKVLAMAGTRNTPLLGTFADEIGCIEVDRANGNSRAATLEAIRQHVDDWKPGNRTLLLFPEGQTSNGDGLLPFKKGAFIPASPVRPIVIYYTGNWHPANVNFKQNSATGEIEPTGDTEWYEQFLGHMVHSLQVKVLPPYIPDGEELRDPQLFADHVRQLMSEAYLQMKTECEQKKEEAETNSWQALARRTLIEKPADLAGKFWSGTVGPLFEETTEDPQERRSANRSSERRRAKKDSDSRKLRKAEKHDKD